MTSIVCDSSVPLLPNQTLPQSLTHSHWHRLSLLSSMGAHDTYTPLFTLKDRASQKLLVTQTILGSIHWTGNANLRLEMHVVHSFLTISDFDYDFLYLFPQTNAELCSRFCGTGRPLCVLCRDRAPMRHKRG